MKRRSEELGFTIIELSIVFVLIALLISGVLAARSMIEATRVRIVIADLSHYDVAIDNFQTRYNQMPGDAGAFSSGNNNGLIEDENSSSSPGLGAEFSGEVAHFWVDLEQSGANINTSAVVHSNQQFASAHDLDNLAPASNRSFTPVVTGPLKIKGAVVNVPSFKLGGDNVGIIATNDNQPSDQPTSVRARGLNGAYIIGDVSAISDGNLSIGPANIKDVFTTEQMLALDSKMDDGKPDTGLVLAFSQAGTCISASVYDLSKTDPACSAAVAMQRNHHEAGAPVAIPRVMRFCEK